MNNYSFELDKKDLIYIYINHYKCQCNKKTITMKITKLVRYFLAAITLALVIATANVAVAQNNNASEIQNNAATAQNNSSAQGEKDYMYQSGKEKIARVYMNIFSSEPNKFLSCHVVLGTNVIVLTDKDIDLETVLATWTKGVVKTPNGDSWLLYANSDDPNWEAPTREIYGVRVGALIHGDDGSLYYLNPVQR